MQRRNKRLADVRHAITHGYVWPGGYPLYTVLEDGGLLCAKCARENYRAISYATRHKLHDGWSALGADVLWETENGPEYCAHCSAELESAYGDVSED